MLLYSQSVRGQIVDINISNETLFFTSQSGLPGTGKSKNLLQVSILHVNYITVCTLYIIHVVSAPCTFCSPFHRLIDMNVFANLFPV